MKGQASNGTLNDNNQNIEQEKFMHQIAKLSRFNFQNNNLTSEIAFTYLTQNATNPKNIPENFSRTNKPVYTNTPLTNRRSLFASKIEKAVNTFKNINNPNVSMSSSSSENIHQNNPYTTNVPVNSNCTINFPIIIKKSILYFLLNLILVKF